MSLFSRYQSWLERRYRSHGAGKDQDWLQQVQAKFPDAFSVTKDFLEDMQDYAGKISLESARGIAFSTGGFLWLLILGIAAWCMQHQLEQWPDALRHQAEMASGGILGGTFLFGAFEVIRMFATSPPTFRSKRVDNLRKFWETILETETGPDVVTEKLDLFIAQERAAQIRIFALDASGNWAGNKMIMGVQCIAVLMVVIFGVIMFDAYGKFPHPTPITCQIINPGHV